MKSAPATDVEWALCTFGLNNLIHKVCYLAAIVKSMRLSGSSLNVETAVASLVAILQSELEAWGAHPLIQTAESE